MLVDDSFEKGEKSLFEPVVFIQEDGVVDTYQGIFPGCSSDKPFFRVNINSCLSQKLIKP